MSKKGNKPPANRRPFPYLFSCSLYRTRNLNRRTFRNLNGRNSLAGAAARSPLKTVHWTVFRAFRTHGACSLSIDLTSDEISATGSRQRFAPWSGRIARFGKDSRTHRGRNSRLAHRARQDSASFRLRRQPTGLTFNSLSAPSIGATVSQTDRLFRVRRRPMRFQPLAVIGCRPTDLHTP